MYETLVGENIILRKARMTDYESMFKNVWSNEEVYKWMLFQPTFTKNEAILRCRDSIEFQKENDAYFIALKTTDEAIGMCAINEYDLHKFEEWGICIGPSYQGRGYGKEVVSLLIDLIFNKLDGVSFKYGYMPENIRSKRIALSFGFEYLETVQKFCKRDNEIKTIEYCILTKEKWKEKR